MKSVLITVPNQHLIHKSVVICIQKLQMDKRYNLKFEYPSHKPYENNLHHIVKTFINGNYDFWLNIDFDNPPIKNPLDLIELDKDIIGLPTPVWHFLDDGKKGERPVYWNGYDYVSLNDAYSEHEPRSGLQKVDSVGTGCVLFAKRVFMNKEMQKGAFTRKLYKDGTVHKGNDMSFCERARNQGFKIFCHYDYPCMHFNNLELNSVVKAFKNLYEK